MQWNKEYHYFSRGYYYNKDFFLFIGERNIFSVAENGKLKYLKKLEFDPSCFIPYGSCKYCIIKVWFALNVLSCHNISEIVLNVVLNTATLTPEFPMMINLFI
jgi:Bardet-Biedl syndrome 9 protein